MGGEVLIGPERRRRWSADEKADLIEESLRPGARIAEIARRHGISRSLLYTWRRNARVLPDRSAENERPEFVPVLLTAPAARRQPSPDRAPGKPLGEVSRQRIEDGGEIEVILPDGARLKLRGRVEATTLRAVLAALKA